MRSYVSAKKLLTQFRALPGMDSVDFESGIIKGVSVMTCGPALGHGITVDMDGLKECLAACQSRGSVRLIDRHDAEFEGIVGSITNFRIEGDQVKGDAELFDNHPMRSRILEIAKKIPTEFGLSIESSGEHAQDPADENKKLFRCADVDAVALVPRPAANDRGLFARKEVDTLAKSSRKKRFYKMKHSKTLLAACDKIRTKFEGETIPSSEELADAIVEAVTEAVAPAVESAVAEVKTTVDEQGAALKKLEEAPELSDEEKEKAAKLEEEKAKEDEEKMTALAEKVAEKKLTKLAAEMGVKRAPGSGSGFVVETEKTKFEAAIQTQLSAGAKDRNTAIFRLAADKPEIYNEARKNGLI